MRTKEKIFKYIDQPTFLFFFARFFFFFFFFHASSAKCISGDRALCSLDNRSVSSFSFLLYFIFSLVHLFFLPFFRVSFVFFYFCCFWFTGRTEGNSKDETQTSPNDRERYRVVGSYYTTSVRSRVPSHDDTVACTSVRNRPIPRANEELEAWLSYFDFYSMFVSVFVSF